MTISWQIVRLVLKETFSISYGNYSFRDTLIISLSYKNEKGFGECIAIDYYKIDLEKYSSLLNTIKSSIENHKIVHPFDFYNFLSQLNLPVFLKSALDCAYWDLFGKLEQISFFDLNSIIINQLPQSSLTISADSIDQQLLKIKKSHWSKFKVKFNHFDENSLNELLNLENEIAIDANGSFQKKDCKWLENFSDAKRFTYIEQPMSPGIDNFSSLKNTSFANWMADEDFQENVSLIDLKQHYSTINIKLVKCGGLTPALSIIKEAKQLDLKVMIGCMTESTVGISAAAVLSPLVDYADLDGACLINNDIAKGHFVTNGNINLTTKHGLGIQML